MFTGTHRFQTNPSHHPKNKIVKETKTILKMCTGYTTGIQIPINEFSQFVT